MEKKESLQSLALELVREKTEKNLKKLYERIKPGLLFYAGNILKDLDAAEDVVSEAFVKIWNRIDQYNPYWNFSTWAYKIVYHETLLYMRKNNRKNSFSLDDMTPSQVKKHLDLFDVPAGEIEENELAVDLLYQKVEEEIYNLPDDYRAIMIDREINHKQYKEIEVLHNIKKNTVKTKIRRARIMIRKKLEKDFPNLVQIYEMFQTT